MARRGRGSCAFALAAAAAAALRRGARGASGAASLQPPRGRTTARRARPRAAAGDVSAPRDRPAGALSAGAALARGAAAGASVGTDARADAAWAPSSAGDGDDTIFALSSGAAGGVSGVAVVRVSGPLAHAAAGALLAPGSSLPAPRRAGVRRLVEPGTGLPLDEALVLTFSAPASFTGEDVSELHVHGSRAVVRATLSALGAQRGVRPAGRGEFARRAFERGRLDLTAAEGLADLLAAETAAQRVQALRAAGGGARAVLDGWRADATRCLAHAEAVLDFGEEAGDAAVFDSVAPQAAKLAAAVRARVAADGRGGELVRDGLRVAIVGPPNAGKSSLLNALAARDVAIVSEMPGTTRDVLAVALDVAGFAVTVADTAGLRDAPADAVEAEGVRRARAAAADADVVLAVGDAAPPDAPAGPACIRVAGKADLIAPAARAKLPPDVLAVSLLAADARADAVARVLDALARAAERHAGRGGKGAQGAQDEQPVVTRARHRYHLERAAGALEAFVAGRAGGEAMPPLPMDIAAEELRIAVREFGAVTGAVHTEEVLDVIFRDFCIGK